MTDASACAHSNVSWPALPRPDHFTTCPDCGEQVGQRGGGVFTIDELNTRLKAEHARVDAAPAHVAVLREALEAITQGVDEGVMREIAYEALESTNVERAGGAQ